MRSVSVLLLLVILGATLASCSHSDTPPTLTPPVVLPPGTFNFKLSLSNVRPLDSAQGRYVLWLVHLDGSMDAVPLTFFRRTRLPDSMSFTGRLTVNPDSIGRAILSIDSAAGLSRPSSTFIAGPFEGAAKSAVLLTTDTEGVGDYSSAAGSVLFTTSFLDTNRAKQEFYLMTMVGGLPTASLTGLPKPKPGWSYGIWVTDSNFYPMHKFFYGSFTDSNGPDSHSSGDSFSFPGGYNPAPLTDASGRIEITLEPAFTVENNRPGAPSPISILWTPLSRFIDFNESRALKNVWKSSAPRGTLTLSR